MASLLSLQGLPPLLGPWLLFQCLRTGESKQVIGQKHLRSASGRSMTNMAPIDYTSSSQTPLIVLDFVFSVRVRSWRMLIHLFLPSHILRRQFFHLSVLTPMVKTILCFTARKTPMHATMPRAAVTFSETCLNISWPLRKI